jgi:hypothetical protein
MAVHLGSHSELNVPTDTVQVVKKLRQLAWTMRLDDERVIRISKPALGLVVPSLPSRLFRVFHEELGDDRA